VSGEALDFSRLPDVSRLHPELEDADERAFAAHMKAREDAYEHIFGQTDPPDQILSPSDAQLQESWPGGGVYAFPPRGSRKAWHYVTHGLSQPFSNPDADDAEPPEADEGRVSGLGIELVIATPERSDWAPSLLVDCVRYLMFDEQAQLIVPGDRMPTRAFKIYAPESGLAAMIATTSDDYGHHILLPAGQCTLVHLVGVTERELSRAKGEGPGAEGTFVLAEVLRALGPGFVTDLVRPCATTDARFEDAWSEAAAKLDAAATGDV
jgi:hypothetical protein